jgi:site-specific DNA-adenine methylase
MSVSKGQALDNPLARAPFPYFGGKLHCSRLVWDAMGDVDSYTEPFGGSLGVLLQRPHYPFVDGRFCRVEMVNDKDHFVSNFWRAVKADPDAVAYHVDNPVNERDLESRHYWLVTEGVVDLAKHAGDPEYYNAKIAGWWAWGLCNWIGTGWCSGTGRWQWDTSTGMWGKGDGGGVNRKIPHLENTGKGVSRQTKLPDSDQGVNRKIPWLGNQGRGISRVSVEDEYANPIAGPREFIIDWLRWLSNRLRFVRVIQGDWDRALSESALGGTTMKNYGIFLDPPYTVGDGDFYRDNDQDLANTVREWAIEQGKNPAYRIVFAGYDSEDHKFPEGWRKEHWKYKGGYSSDKKSAKETLWFSPGCLEDPNVEGSFF